MTRMIQRKIVPSPLALIALFSLVIGSSLAIDLAAGRALAAQPPQPPARPPLPVQIEEARGQFRPITHQDAAAAKARLQHHLVRLDQQLVRGPVENTERWRRFLRWNDLHEQLAAEEPSLSELEAIYLKFRGSHQGLDMPRFIQARQSLRAYINSLFFARNAEYENQFAAQLQTLSEALTRYLAERQPEDAATIGQTLGWLEQGNQVPELVQAVREELEHPNLLVDVSADFIARGVHRRVNEVAPIRDVILGTQIYGNGRTVGHLGAELVPHPNRGVIEFAMNARNLSNNVGYNGPLTIYSSGDTSLLGGKQIQIGPDGVTGLPPWAKANTHTTFTGFGAKHNLVRKIGSRRAYQQKAQAEAIAGRKAESRLARRLEEEVSEFLVDANRRLDEEVYRPLRGRDSMPRELDFHTTRRAIGFRMLQSSLTQLAAPGAPPAFEGPRGAISVQVHESLAINLGEAFLGGLQLTDERLEQLLLEADVDVPEELRITPDTEPWSITFDNYRPIEAVFGDGHVELSIRGRQFTRGDTAVNRTIRISANYRVDRGEQGAVLTREGEVVVDFVRQERLGPRDLAAKTFLTRKFDALFQPEIAGEGIELEGEFAKLGRLTISNLSVTPGWFSASWDTAAAAPAAISKIESPADEMQVSTEAAKGNP